MTDVEMIKKLKLLARADIYGGTGSLAFLLEIAERLEELTGESYSKPDLGDLV